ncbi:MAG: helix-turn-helix domain-containing protein [Gammaproteobacteria bacterium]|nr:helix-turn-helix domain-containing protein [Gammaproteobacteria bacterium]
MKKTANNDSNGAIQENIRIGSQIRDLRKSKGITLSVMAEKIGKSVGYMSQIERGVSSLPIPVLQSISEVLGVQITWFFHTDNPIQVDELNYIVRKDARRRLNFTGTGISEELLSPRMSGDLLMILTTFAPGAKSDKTPRKRKGEEAGYIQSGTLDLTIGNKQFSLHEGDSFSIAGSKPHFVYNPSPDQDAIVVWTLTPGLY